jgi:hypothetical protein
MFASQVADDELHAGEHIADRHHADVHDALAQVAELPFQSLISLLKRAPFGGREYAFGPLEVRGQPSAADDQLADQSHQLVETRQVDSHYVCNRA